MQEIRQLPEWEVQAWRMFFEVYGPLDWRREDLLFARVNQYQSTGQEPLRKFTLFPDPGEKQPVQTEDDVFAELKD